MPALSEPVRAWLYRVSLAVIPLLAVYGIIDESAVAGWAALAVAMFNTGMASLNTSTTAPPPLNRDRGESALMTILIVLAIVVLVFFLINFVR